MMIIDGKKEAEILRHEIKKEIDSLKSKNNKVPGLTVILIGDFAPSQIYVKNKEKSAKEVGINSNVVRYSKDVTEKEVLKKIEDLNNDTNVSGILVQLPLPPQINKEKIINAVSPKKDVDASARGGAARAAQEAARRSLSCLLWRLPSATNSASSRPSPSKGRTSPWSCGASRWSGGTSSTTWWA